MTRLMPPEVIIPSVAANEASTSEIISKVGAVVTSLCFDAGNFEMLAGNTTTGLVLWASTAIMGALNIRSFFRGRAFRQRELELRGLPIYQPRHSDLLA